MPHFQMTTKLDSSKLSHDVDDNKSYEADELCHDTGTLEGLAGMLDRAAGLDTGEVVLRDWEGLRVLAVHGDGDEVTSAEATKGFFERCKVRDSEVKVYGGCFHNRECCPIFFLWRVVLWGGDGLGGLEGGADETAERHGGWR